MKKAVIYLRVSTEEQAEKGFSLQAQREECLQKAKELACDAVAEFSDEGVSGSILERPMLLSALEELKKEAVDYFICYEPSRLSRNVSHQLILIDSIKKQSTKLIFIRSRYEDTAEGRFQLTIMAAVDEYERARLKIRTELGKRAKASHQILTHNPNLYGYTFDKEKDILIINPEQAAIVRLIYQLFLEQQQSPAQITEQLNHMGISSMRSKSWSRVSVSRILKNYSYTGIMYIRRYDTRECKSNKYKKKDEKIKAVERPREQWIPINIPSIIDSEAWQKAQNCLEKGKRTPKGNLPSVYLLSGLLTCKKCGGTMFGKGSKKNGGQKLYYCCSNKYNYSISKEERCSSRLIKSEVLEQELWQYVTAWIRKSVMINLNEKGEARRGPCQAEDYNQLIKASLKEKEKLLILFQKSFIDEEELNTKMKQIEEKIDYLGMESIKNEGFSPKQKILDHNILENKLEELSVSMKNRLLHLMIKEIVVDEETAQIVTYLPEVVVLENSEELQSL